MVVPHRSTSARSSLPISRAGGFSLFELVVFIICVAIIYAYAANRFAEFPAAAERANFTAVLTQMQSGVNLEFLLGRASGTKGMEAFEGVNPMDLLLEPPSNYLGSFSGVDETTLPRRSWYFNSQDGELVYLVEASDNVYFVTNGSRIPTGRLSFRLDTRYRYEDTRTGLPVEVLGGESAIPEQYLDREVAGLVLSPVRGYEWSGPELALSELATSG